MTRSSSKVRISVCLAILLAMLIAAPIGYLTAIEPINVPVGPKEAKGVGIGFGLLTDPQNDLTVNFNYTGSKGGITYSQISDKTGKAAWIPPQQGDKKTPMQTHTYTAAGVSPNDGHAVIFEGNYAEGGEDIVIPQGPPPPVDFDFRAFLCDVDLDADTDNNNGKTHRAGNLSDDEDRVEYPISATDKIAGLLLPVNDDNDISWDTVDCTYDYAKDDDLLDAALTINAKIKGTVEFNGDLYVYDDKGEKLTYEKKEIPAAQYKPSLRLASHIYEPGERTGLTDDLYIIFKPSSPNGDPAAAVGANAVDTIRYTNVRTDIDVDTNNDKSISDDDWLSDGDDFYENHLASRLKDSVYEYGMIVPVNNDDDDADSNADNGATKSGDWSGPGAAKVEAGDNDLKPMKLRAMKFNAVTIAALESRMAKTDVRLKQISGAGAVRIFTTGANPQVFCDNTSSGTQNKLPDGTTLWNALKNNQDVELQVEGLKKGEVILEIAFLVDSKDGDKDIVVHKDSVRITVDELDADVDSNNDGKVEPTNIEEDSIEDTAGKSGKVLAVNEDDTDGDNVVDTIDWQIAGDSFAELVITLPEIIDVSKATIRFTYSASDPAKVASGKPAAGNLRIWKKNANEDRSNVASVANGGAYVPSDGAGFAVTDLGAGKKITLYIEGIAAVEGGRILVELDPDGSGTNFGFLLNDAVRVTVTPPIDIDVDSDNNNSLNAPDRSQAEDDCEDVTGDPKKPGKVIVANDNDIDDDGVADFADGFDFDGVNGNGDDALTGGAFTPLVIEIPAPIDLAKAKIKFSYSGSDPSQVDFVEYEPYNYYLHASGTIRIWTKNGDQKRRKNSVTAAQSGDFIAPDEEIQVSKLGLTGTTRQVTLYIEGIEASTDIASTSIIASVSPDGESSNYVMTDIVRLMVITVDLDVDTNRNGGISQLDETKESEWSKGAKSRGAIILPNCDKDSPATTKGPDNWIGGNWDGITGSEPANTKVDGGNDIDDVGPLYVPKLGTTTVPDNMSISISIAKPATENAYFVGTTAKPGPAANKRVRIFLPTNAVSSSRLCIKEGDEEIIGPSTGDTVEFVKSPTGSQKDISIFGGNGRIEFGIEGIEMGAMVDITITAKLGTATLSKDTVRVRVAPYTLLDHTCPVAGTGKSVFVHDLKAENQDLRNVLSGIYGARVCVSAATSGSNDPWHQDGYEVGYAKAPYGQLPIFLVSPRSKDESGAMLRFVHDTRLEAGIGVCWRIEDVSGIGTYDSFGNVECMPLSLQPGKWFSGQSLHNDIENFFKAQDVNAAVAANVNTDWLAVGHVDEVISFASDGSHVVVADPELCWAILLWADKVDPAALMLQGMNDGDKTVRQIVSDAARRTYNIDPAGHVMKPGNLPQIRDTILNLPSPESTPAADAANVGNGVLGKGGVFIAFFPNNNRRTYRIIFTSATDYNLEYQEAGGAWMADGAGKTTEDSIFTAAKCFIFKHWWSGTSQIGDQFTFEADPSCKTIEMPVLFREHPYCPGKAIAYTIDHVNSLVDGNTVVTGYARGPQVNFDGAGVKDILDDYVAAAFAKAGYTNLKRANSIEYHNYDGNIHCGTNVRRTIPSYDWWEK